MARVPVSAEDSAYITARVAAFSGEAPQQLRWQTPYVEEFAALPLYIGWTEAIGLRPDGEVIRWSTEGDYTGAQPVEEPVLVRAGLVEGTKRFPGLRGLIPARPPGACTCPVCGGVGHPPGLPHIGCSCGGVGWVDVEVVA
jgi:hypothetical protein